MYPRVARTRHFKPRPPPIIITVHAQYDGFPAKLSECASNFTGQRASLILGIRCIRFLTALRTRPGAGETRALDLVLARSPSVPPAESPTLRQQPKRYECSFAQRRVARAPRPRVCTSESQECTRASRTSSCGRCLFFLS